MQQRARLCAGTGGVTSIKLLMHFAILVRARHSSCTPLRRCGGGELAGENQFGTVENLSAVYFQFSSKLRSLSRHRATIPSADNYFSLEITLTTHLLA